MNTGASFEQSVKATLEVLGFDVTRDELLAGSQVDLVATLRGPVINQVMLVECKDTADQQGVDVVRTAYAVKDSIKGRYPFAIAMVVCRSGYTNTAKASARELGVHLTTLQELKSKLFDPGPYVDEIIRDYEAGELCGSYVDLSCHVNERGVGTIYKPVEAFIDTFIQTSAKSGLAVMGNFGSGKTSLCAHYAYLLAQRWHEVGGVGRLPILVHLRELRDFFDLDEAIFQNIRKRFEAPISAHGVKSWLSAGNCLLILDGLDEMAAGMNRKQVSDNLIALSNYVKKNDIKVLITCRTHFFKTFIEEDLLGDVIKLYVREWGQEELINFIKKAVPGATGPLLDAIGNTYNLHELAKTPIFLKMIVDTSGDLKGKVNPAKLYKVYTDRWIEDQDYRSAMQPEDKNVLMQELAAYMDSNDVNALSYREIPRIIKDFFGLDSHEMTQHLESEVRSCSFLVRDDDGIYRFSHKSFREYFVATKLATQIKSRGKDDFALRIYSREICGFVANYFDNEVDLIIGRLFDQSVVAGRINATSVLANLGQLPSVERALILALETERSPEVQSGICDALSLVGSEASALAMIAFHRSGTGDRDFAIRGFSRLLAHGCAVEFVKSLLANCDETAVEVAVEVALAAPHHFERDIAERIRRTGKFSARLYQLYLHFAREMTMLETAKLIEKFMTTSAAEAELESARRDGLKHLSRNFRAGVEAAAHAQARSHAEHSRAAGEFVGRKNCEESVRREFGYLANADHLSGLMDRLFPQTVRKKIYIKKR